jgi:hypothetical protein
MSRFAMFLRAIFEVAVDFEFRLSTVCCGRRGCVLSAILFEGRRFSMILNEEATNYKDKCFSFYCMISSVSFDDVLSS